MNEISNKHAFEDEDFLHACFVWGMVVVGVFAVCLVPVFMLLGGPADLDAADAGGWMAVVVMGLATKEEVGAYDYTSGYPEKLVFNL